MRVQGSAQVLRVLEFRVRQLGVRVSVLRSSGSKSHKSPGKRMTQASVLVPLSLNPKPKTPTRKNRVWGLGFRV